METVTRVEQAARRAPVPALPPSRLSRVAGWSAYASGLIGTVSVFFFVLFAGAYVTTGRPAPWPIGRINDLTSLLMYLVALPIALELHQRLKPRALASAGWHYCLA